MSKISVTSDGREYSIDFDKVAFVATGIKFLDNPETGQPDPRKAQFVVFIGYDSGGEIPLTYEAPGDYARALLLVNKAWFGEDTGSYLRPSFNAAFNEFQGDGVDGGGA